MKHILNILSIILLIQTGINSKSENLYNFDFEDGYQGWIADFADYPVGDSANWNLNHSHQIMPDIVPGQYGLRMVGDNFSDDLFFYIKRKIEGLIPHAEYRITFSIDIVSNMPPDGVGGSDLMLKAGAAIVEPKKIIVDEAGTPYYRMNIDKGNQSQPGAAMDTLGHINHDISGDFSYYAVNYKNEIRPFEIVSDSNGELWLIIGAESQWETPAAEFLVAHAEIMIDNLTSLEENKEISPYFHLYQNYPNPFNPTTKISFMLPEPAFVTLEVFNTLGQKVEILLTGKMHAGLDNVEFDASELPGGVYFYRLQVGETPRCAGDFREVRKMILLK